MNIIYGNRELPLKSWPFQRPVPTVIRVRGRCWEVRLLLPGRCCRNNSVNTNGNDGESEVKQAEDVGGGSQNRGCMGGSAIAGRDRRVGAH